MFNRRCPNCLAVTYSVHGPGPYHCGTCGLTEEIVDNPPPYPPAVPGPHCPACDGNKWIGEGEDKKCARCDMTMADCMEFSPLSAAVEQPRIFTPEETRAVPPASRLERLVFALIASQLMADKDFTPDGVMRRAIYLESELLKRESQNGC